MKIRYITLHGVAEWIDFNDDDQDVLTLSFEPYHNGAIVMNGKFFALNDGEVTIPLTALQDGVCTPLLESDTGVYCVESFTKQGKGVSVSKSNEESIRRLISRHCNLEKKVTELTEKMKKLEDKCNGHSIFDFERKEK